MRSIVGSTAALLALVVGAPCAMAEEAAPAFSGFYIGAGVGAVTDRVNVAGPLLPLAGITRSSAMSAMTQRYGTPEQIGRNTAAAASAEFQARNPRPSTNPAAGLAYDRLANSYAEAAGTMAFQAAEAAYASALKQLIDKRIDSAARGTGTSAALYAGWGATLLWERLYAGIEVGGGYSSATTKMDISVSAYGFEDSSHIRVEGHLSAYTQARVGLVIAPSIMAYGLLGYEGVHYNIGRDGRRVMESWLGGVRYGAGVEAQLGRGFFGRLEWSRTDLNDVSIKGGKISADRSSSVLSIGYKF